MSKHIIPIEINIVTESDLWSPHIVEYESLIKEAIGAAVVHCPDVAPGSVLSVVLANNDFVQDLNHQYRGKNKPTNVLSFPAGEDDFPEPLGELGDIILAFETIVLEAETQGKSFKDHLQHLVIHGFLHLRGYDHEEDHEATIMESLEIKILKDLNIQNPYDV